jgi:hypothetical protein
LLQGRPTTATVSPAVAGEGPVRLRVFDRANKQYVALPSTAFPNWLR